MKKKINFLKVTFSLIMIFTSSFIMSSCGEEETTSIVSNYEQFKNNFDEHYPDGYVMEDGWYSVRSVETNYSVDSKDKAYTYNTKSNVFTGDLEFSDSLDYIEGKVNSFSMNWFGSFTTCYEEGSMKSYDNEIQSCYDGINYSLIDNYEAHWQFNYGTDTVENLPFNFNLGTEYNGSYSSIPNKSFYYNLDGKSIRINLNYTKKDIQNGIVYYYESKVTDTCTFDDDFKLIENRRTTHRESTLETSDFKDYTIIMTPAEEIEIEVPAEYDTELTSSYVDELEIKI